MLCDFSRLRDVVQVWWLCTDVLLICTVRDGLEEGWGLAFGRLTPLLSELRVPFLPGTLRNLLPVSSQPAFILRPGTLQGVLFVRFFFFFF